MERINDKEISVFFINAHSEGDFRPGASFVMDGWILGICTEGSMEYQTNMESHHAQKGSCFSWLPGQVCSILQLSHDAQVTLLLASSDSLVAIRPHLIQRSSATPASISSHIQRLDHLHDSPGMPSLHVKLPDDVCLDIQHLLQVLSHHVSPLSQHPNLNLAYSIIESISWLLLSCHHQPQHDSHPLSRQELLTKDFFNELIHSHRQEHYVSFYAEKVSVTPKYLSSVVRQITGSSPQEWIEKLLVFSSKRLLRSTDLTVAQIAHQLCFSSPSAFVRFFRSNAGITPKDYRLNQ